MFEWDTESKARDYLMDWVREKKLTCRLEGLQPGEWFKSKSTDWTKILKEWQAKQKSSAKAKPAANEGEDAEEEDVDIFSVEDVTDIGNGTPLFKEFTFEDWVIIQFRFELYLLVKAFLKDADDPERSGIPESHFEFYYGKYFTRRIVPKSFGFDSLQEVLLKLGKDIIGSNGAEVPILELKLTDEIEKLDIFCKLTEDGRRERQRRIDAGDETAKLKFQPACMMNRLAAISGANAPKQNWKQGQQSGAWQKPAWTPGQAWNRSW